MVLNRLMNESGVAMVTVLFIAAVLTAVSTAGVYVTIQELRATSDDRRGAQSLAFAEAGIDQILVRLRNGSLGWGDIAAAGCTVSTPDGTITYPPISLSGNVAGSAGTYDAELTVYNRDAANPADRLPPSACPSTFPSPAEGARYFAITSTGSQPAAQRVVRQVIQIRPLGLPIAIYAIERVDGNGTTIMDSISMITEGVISKRDQFGFRGTDPYYSLWDFYGGSNSKTTKIPAAAHARGQITYGPASSLLEHRPGFEANCEANEKGTVEQSLWDGSGTAELDQLTRGCAGWVSPGAPAPASGTWPPTAKFDEAALERVAPRPDLSERDYQALRSAAKSNGIYCVPAPSSKLTCTYPGGSSTENMTFENNNPIFSTVPNDFVFYVDFPTEGDPFGGSKTITWKRSVQPCSYDQAISRSVVIVIRNGSISMEGGSYIVGAMLIPEGMVTNKGEFTLEGTVIAQRLDVRGSATFKMTPCWVNNLPGPFLDTIPATWSEIDR